MRCMSILRVYLWFPDVIRPHQNGLKQTELQAANTAPWRLGTNKHEARRSSGARHVGRPATRGVGHLNSFNFFAPRPKQKLEFLILNQKNRYVAGLRVLVSGHPRNFFVAPQFVKALTHSNGRPAMARDLVSPLV